MGLNIVYNTVRSSLLMRDLLPTLNKAYSILIQEEGMKGEVQEKEQRTDPMAFVARTSGVRGSGGIEKMSGRWGCALTAKKVDMIHHHAFNLLVIPNGGVRDHEDKDVDQQKGNKFMLLETMVIVEAATPQEEHMWHRLWENQLLMEQIAVEILKALLSLV